MSERLEVDLGANGKELADKLKKAEGQVKQFGNSAEKINKTVSASFSNLSSSIAGLVSAGAIIGLGKQILSTTAQFEKFGAVLSNTLGSNALSQLKLQEIQDFAAKTPFGVAELTSSFVKLANQGFKPSSTEMRKLGDVAAATGKSFDQLAEAILDATTGEFERLKEFGVRAKDAGDKVIFTFKGVSTTVDKTAESIRNYVTSLGDVEGVSGSMAVISETLTGKISNLGDTWDQMLVSVGSNTSGVFSGAIGIISKAIEKITQYNNELNTQQKYQLEGDLFQKLNRGLNPFANQGGTDLELQVAGIANAADRVNAFVTKSIEGAKSAKDFSKAIRELAKDAREFSLVPGVAQSKGEIKGIKDQYIQGMQALKDAAINFLKPAAAPGNFGGGEKKKTEAEILKSLGIELKTIEITGKATGETFLKGFSDAMSAKSKAIGELLKIGINPNSSTITGLAASIAKISPLPDGLSAKFANLKDSITESTLKINTSNLVPFEKGLKDIADRMPQYVSYMKETLDQFNQDAGDIISGGLIDTFMGLGDAIGTALSGGSDAISNLGATLLTTLGSVLGQLGQMAIATGVAILGIKTALETLNPFVAIAAGVALLALSGVVKGQVSKIGSSAAKGSGGGTVNTPRQSYSPASPQSASGSTASLGGRVVFEISGTNLIGVLNRAGGSVRRLGG